ncbi:MAG: DUF72 domain-containing protein [Promethearchaeota archaeon]
MSDFHVGCAGWSYDDWKGSFYPKRLKKSQYLSYYGKIFDFVEVNTTFYHIPTKNTFQQWESETPADFFFGIKLWQKFSHKFDYATIDEEIRQFFAYMDIISHKIPIFLLQFPPKFRNKPERIQKLRYLMKNFPKYANISYMVEFRHDSWFESDIADLFQDYPNWKIATSYLRGASPFYPINQSQYYIRMIGDHQLEKFNRTQRNEDSLFSDVLTHSQEMQSQPSITDIFVIFNNHFRGFSPVDVNEYKKRMQIPTTQFIFQKTLQDFL